MSYSIQLYTLRRPLEQDLAGTIKKVAEIGFTQVEPYNFAATAKELGAALTANGLTAPSGHAPLLSQDQDEIFAAARELGIGTVIEPYRPAEHWQSALDIQSTAAQLNAAARKGSGYGIRVGYHNHQWELESTIEGRTALEYFADLLDPELVLEVDTFWVAVGGRGKVAVRDVIKSAKSLEVGVVEFDDYAGDIFEGIAESLAFLTRTGADAGDASA